MHQTVRPAASAPLLDHAQIRTIMVGVVLAMLLGALDQTIVATALPTIGRELNDVQDLSWVVTAYLLTSTAATPLYGKLSDVHGRRAMLLLAIAIFLGGSVACAVSRNIFLLIGARALQGLGGGGLLSLGQTIVGDVVAPRERGRYQAYFAAIFVTSSIAGPALGGIFAEHLHWSFVFWINLPLGAVAYFLTNRVLKILPRHERPHRIDWLGASLMTAATVLLLLALSWGGTTYAWDSVEIVGLLVASGIAWVVFGLHLARAPEPFIPLDLLANSVVRYGVIGCFFAVGVVVGLAVYLPLYFEAVLGFTAGQSGLALIVFMAATVMGALTSGRIMMRVAHYKRTAVIGLAVSVPATLVLARWPHLPFVQAEIVLFIAGVGIGTIFPIATTALQNAVPMHQLGTATAILNFFRSLGGAFLVTGFGAVLLASAAASSVGHGSVETVILAGATAGVDFAPIFSGVFYAAAAANLLAFFAMLAMKELPLRRTVTTEAMPVPDA
jgi:EmrB/QacA subfamily drug resistance transporter